MRLFLPSDVQWAAIEPHLPMVHTGPAGADIRLRVEELAGLVRDLTATAPAALEAAA